MFGGSSVSLTFITVPFLQEEYRNSMPASSFQQQKLRVCEVCSAYLGLHDNDRRLADHFGGKLHLGFIQIREKLDQLRVGSWIVVSGETGVLWLSSRFFPSREPCAFILLSFRVKSSVSSLCSHKIPEGPWVFT